MRPSGENLARRVFTGPSSTRPNEAVRALESEFVMLLEETRELDLEKPIRQDELFANLCVKSESAPVGCLREPSAITIISWGTARSDPMIFLSTEFLIVRSAIWWSERETLTSYP